MIDLAVDQFSKRWNEYDQFTKKLEILIRDLLTAESIDFHLIESRTKSTKSFREKITKTAKSYNDPLLEVTDLCGLRVIAYYQDSVDTIVRLISSEFQIDEKNSLIHCESDAEFGYKSSHLIIRLKQERGVFREWQGFSGFPAEIQVRTVLQHAWAAISHKLQYKREADVPQLLKRKLLRLSALFEIADDEFVSLRIASSSVKKDIVEKLAGGNRKLPLDAISLNQFLATSPFVAEICSKAEEVGFNFEQPDWVGREDPDTDRVSDLVNLAKTVGLQSVEEFNAKISQAIPWSKEYFAAQYQANAIAGSSSWHVSPAFVCELIILRSCINHIRLGDLIISGYMPELGKRILNVARTYKNF